MWEHSRGFPSVFTASKGGELMQNKKNLSLHCGLKGRLRANSVANSYPLVISENGYWVSWKHTYHLSYDICSPLRSPSMQMCSKKVSGCSGSNDYDQQLLVLDKNSLRFLGLINLSNCKWNKPQAFLPHLQVTPRQPCGVMSCTNKLLTWTKCPTLSIIWKVFLFFN